MSTNDNSQSTKDYIGKQVIELLRLLQTDKITVGQFKRALNREIIRKPEQKRLTVADIRASTSIPYSIKEILLSLEPNDRYPPELTQFFRALDSLDPITFKKVKRALREKDYTDAQINAVMKREAQRRSKRAI